MNGSNGTSASYRYIVPPPSEYFWEAPYGVRRFQLNGQRQETLGHNRQSSSSRTAIQHRKNAVPRCSHPCLYVCTRLKDNTRTSGLLSVGEEEPFDALRPSGLPCESL